MHRLIASFFGIGLILRRVRNSDGGSGTLAGLVALPLSLWLGSWLGWGAQLTVAVVVTAASLWSSSALADETGDAGWIVIDEVAGTFVATIGLGGWPAIIAFVVFRIADINKTWFPGVSRADRHHGGLGITADDTIAAIYGLVIGHLVALTLF
jgi:phosphatidylglycerophosphatase A